MSHTVSHTDLYDIPPDLLEFRDLVRRLGDADAADGRRGDREGVREQCADPDAPRAGVATDLAVRLARAQGRVAPAVRDRRARAGVRAVRARGGLGPGRDADNR